MQTIILTILVISVAVLVMSIGTIFSNIRLKGSCGGNSEDCVCSLRERMKCQNNSLTTPS